MPHEDDLLPTFDRPPLGEVALIAQFERLSGLRNIDLLEVWRKTGWSERYPVVGEYAELPSFREVFSAGFPDSWVVKAERPVARYNFRNEERGEQVQIQRDRFAFYWHHKNPYPRFGQLLETFRKEYAIFESFARTAGWGSIVPNHCAVSYSNDIRKGREWSTITDLQDVFTFLKSDTSRALPSNMVPEAIHYVQSFLISEGSEPFPRMYVSCIPREGEADLIDFELLVRGFPKPASGDALSEFFGMGRKKIVVTFEALTTTMMHVKWGKRS
jgi:uncharacterized protein (TIGR04255 family)